MALTTPPSTRRSHPLTNDASELASQCDRGGDVLGGADARHGRDVEHPLHLLARALVQLLTAHRGGDDAGADAHHPAAPLPPRGLPPARPVAG